MDVRRRITRTNIPDTTDQVGAKFRKGVDWVEKGYDDRWPARGQANLKAREYRPLDDVSRQGRQREYLRRPDAEARKQRE